MDFGPSKVRHGTRTGYVYGCRCKPCVMANREWKRTWAGDVPWDDYVGERREGMQKHGAAAYARGCRCAVCRTARADQMLHDGSSLRRRARRRGVRRTIQAPDTKCSGCGRLFRGEYGLIMHRRLGCPGPVLTRFKTQARRG